jgi:hypothetical protein
VLCPDECLIDFNFYAHLFERACLHYPANPMHHEPCRLLCHTNAPGYLAGANTILAINHEPHCSKPLIQPDGTVLKNGSNLDGVLLAAGLALEQVTCLEPREPTTATTRAFNAIRPPKWQHEKDAIIDAGEVLDRL